MLTKLRFPERDPSIQPALRDPSIARVGGYSGTGPGPLSVKVSLGPPVGPSERPGRSRRISKFGVRPLAAGREVFSNPDQAVYRTDKGAQYRDFGAVRMSPREVVLKDTQLPEEFSPGSRVGYWGNRVEGNARGAFANNAAVPKNQQEGEGVTTASAGIGNLVGYFLVGSLLFSFFSSGKGWRL